MYECSTVAMLCEVTLTLVSSHIALPLTVSV